MIKIPTLALAAVAALFMWGTAGVLPSLTYTFSWSNGLDLAAASLGLIICLAAVLEFRRYKTTVNPLTPDETSHLVTSGVYQISRNPMYLGFLLMLAGWAA